MSKRPTFYRILLDYEREIPLQLDSTMSRTGRRAGPFPAPHLEGMAEGWKSMGSGFPPNSPPDRIIYEFDARRPLLDFIDRASWWIISEAAHDILLRYAQGAIDLAPVDVLFRRKGQDRPADQHWQCDVIRFEDAVDQAASEIHWTTDGKQYDSNSKLVFRLDLPADLHLFRVWYEPRAIVCSAELRDALLAARLSGVLFKEI